MPVNDYDKIKWAAGFEHHTKTTENQHNPKTTGPKSGPVPPDPDLQTVIDRWPELPPPIRRQIVKLALPSSLALAGVRKKVPGNLTTPATRHKLTSMTRNLSQARSDKCEPKS